ncbi:hypothetical protein WP12_04435 [Sphingomonas sp. SRS2]|nr:hypothetical protein WP12_04435 [Sphingomonas sp. SRS2]
MDAGDVRRLLDEAPMSRLQIQAVAVLVALSMLDGYDVISIGFAGPLISQSLNIGKTALGAVFSSGLIGMAIGSLLLAPLADTFGRRAAILGALLLMMAGGIGCTLAGSTVTLVASRVVSGLGIGTLIAVSTPLAAEFANMRRRAFAVSVTTMAFPMGAMLGGLAASMLMDDLGWRAIFAAKSILAAILLPLVLIALPESPSFLMSSAKHRAAERLSAFLARCGHGPVSVSLGPVSRGRQGYTDLFAPGQIGVTAMLVAVNALFAMVGYFWGSWLPNMIVDAGYPASAASFLAAMNQLAGVVGGLLLGFAAKWINLRSLAIAALAAAGVAIALFGFVPAQLSWLTLAAASCGFCIHASISGLYATIAMSFKEHVRASGTGLVLGVGRISSSIAPLLAGWMFANGFERNLVSLSFAALAILASLILAFSPRGTGLKG